MASYVLRGGRIFDGEKFYIGNVGVKDGVIAELGEIKETYERVFDVSSCIVSAGLVDIHIHMKGVSTDMYGVAADAVCLPFGVTAAVDGGAEKGDKRFLDTLSINADVFVFAPFKKGKPDYEKLDELLLSYGEKAVGVKVYYDENQAQKPALQRLRLVCEYAHERNLKVMVHCAGSPDPMWELVNVLKKGDILTHIYHGGENTIVDEDFRAYKLAKEKGVILDAGMAGGVHTNWSVLKKAAARGYFPDTVSSDVTNGSAFVRGGNFGLPMCMSIMRSVGMEETEIFRSVTTQAGQAVNRPWGRLRVGERADVAVLRFENEPFRAVDGTGEYVTSEEGYVCKMTIVGGQILYRAKL